MADSNRARRLRVAGALTAGGAMVAAGLAASPTVAEPDADRGGPAPFTVVVDGLDNPRQMHLLGNGTVIVAEAGHGSYKAGNCDGGLCIGRTGKIGRLKGGGYKQKVTGLLSFASADGTFAAGADGVARRKPGKLMPVMTYAPPQAIPSGTKGKRQLGKLLINRPKGSKSVLADISRFEERFDPDGEGVDSNPYAGLGLKNKTLVADAAGDYIAAVRPKGKVELWATMPEYGKRVDAVPTVITRAGNGAILVGELHSEQPNQAKVLVFNRGGERVNAYRGFTSVTGVARTKDGTLYVSELFSGCGPGAPPNCTPGRVIRVEPDGDRSRLKVPFPAGIVARGDRVLVAAWSIAPKNGAFGGGAQTSGQIRKLNFDAR